MAKRKNKNNLVNDVVRLSVLLVGIVATVLLLLKAFKVQIPIIGALELEGLKVAFGDEDSNVKGNFLIALAILLPAGAGVVSFLLNNKLGNLVAVVMFALGILLLVTLKLPLTSNVSVDLKLTTIGYVSLVLSVLGTLGSAYKLLVK